MFEWLDKQMHAGQDPTYPDVMLRIIAALVLGCVVACIHHYTRPREDGGTKGLVATLVLLSILLSMVILTVGSNIARAFTLAGVLAIVRFRTVLKDTRDIAFVICAVVVGMAAGAGYLAYAIIGLPVIAVAAYFTQEHKQMQKIIPASNLHLRFLVTHLLQQPVEEVLKRYVDALSVRETSTCKKGTAFDVTYRIRMKRGMLTLDMVRELHALEGMQSVEWKA